MALQKRMARRIKISTSFERFFRYQCGMDDVDRDELFEMMIVAYYRACAAEDDGIPAVPGLGSVAQLQATTPPTLAPGQAGGGTAGDGLGRERSQ